MTFLKKITGYRTYIAGMVMILLGFYALFFIPSPAPGVFQTEAPPPGLIRVITANTAILNGLAIIFLRMGQKNTEERILSAIERRDNAE